MLSFDDDDLEGDGEIALPEKKAKKKVNEPLTHATSRQAKKDYHASILAKENPSPIERRHRELKLLAQHSTKSVEHYLPVPYVEAAREVMGGIDLDPATFSLANKVVKAASTFGYWYDPTGTLQFIDGLIQSWHGKVLLNPPGGKTSKHNPALVGISKSYAAVWWGKLAAEWLQGNIEQAIFIGFNVEILLTTQKLNKGLPLPLDFPMCFPRKRIAFDYPEDTYMGRALAHSERTTSSKPACANVIVYLPPKQGEGWAKGIPSHPAHRFADTFGQFGRVVVP